MATVRAADLVVSRLEEQVRELRAALEDAAEGICRIDRAGRVVSVNRAFLRLFGLSGSDAPGRMLGGAAGRRGPAGESRSELSGAAGEDRARADRGAGRRARRFRCSSRSCRSSTATAAVPGLNGHYLFIHDLSDRKRMENQLIFAGRMAAVGTLAAGVAHEINNPLAYIVANIDFARHADRRIASRMSRSAAAEGAGARAGRDWRGADRGAAGRRAGAATSCGTCKRSRAAATTSSAGRSTCGGCWSRRSTWPGTRSATARGW